MFLVGVLVAIVLSIFGCIRLYQLRSYDFRVNASYHWDSIDM